MSRRRYAILTGQMSSDPNVRQAFSTTENAISKVSEDLLNQQSEIEQLKDDLSGYVLQTVAGLDANSSTTTDIINALTTLSQRLKEL